MQRVSSLLPSWDRSRSSASSYASNHTRRTSVEKVRGWADKIPSSRSSRLVKEAFWPATLDKECEKAARILKSFCSDGFSTAEERPGSPLTHSSARSSGRILKKIPPRLIQNAVGLAVFTSMRSGLWTTGSGGSGILIARKTDGSWSPPSGLVLQTPSLGFVIGVDIYDCVVIINSFTVLEAFARPKLTLGADVILTTGPLVSVGLLENDFTWTDLSEAAITYVKARGQFSEARLDGTILQERKEENERFYGMTLGVAKILSGDINQSLPQVRPLTEVLKAAEGRVDYDTALVESLSSQPAPSDATIESSTTPLSSPALGLPTADDPDPFGILALEMAGVGIREAGTHLRPESSQFEFHPSPTSPVFPKVKRGSIDTATSRSNRGSYMSSKTVGTDKSQITDACTQAFSTTPETTPTHSQSQSEDGYQLHSPDEVQRTKKPTEVDYTQIDISSLRMLSNFPDLEEPIPKILASKDDAPVENTIDDKYEGNKAKAKEGTTNGSLTIPTMHNENEGDADDEEDGNSSAYRPSNDGASDDGGSDYDDELDDELDDGEEAVVFEVATAQAPTRVAIVGTQIMPAKGAVVTIPKRVPPPLPARSPARASRRRSQMPDVGSMVSSPLRKEFDPVEISGSATPRGSKILEPTEDALEKEAPEGANNAVDDKSSESPLGSPTTLAPEFQERSAKRASRTAQVPSAEKQTNMGSDHEVTVSAP
ncbi:putative las seventeen-binding protein [Rosellinia necatrix]|uniref:Putative las seventeen-binding protein n=1 Tax=Rosellinia necatrix TaxID=77044 RepID=A0A1W2TDK3_ROSNE|nr:putative las seventeen-binding protein [Rosellinia necatrix]